LAVYRKLFTRSETAPGQGPLLVIAPHPDDELLGPGATLADAVRDGRPVAVAIASAGDAYYLAVQLWYNRPPAPELFRDQAEIRQGESRAAMGTLGLAPAQVHFFGFPDGGTDQMWATWHDRYRSPTADRDAVYCATEGRGRPFAGASEWAAMMALLDRVHPAVLFTAHPFDTHGDHWATANFARLALESWRAAGQTWAQACRVRSFLIHWGPWPGRDASPHLPIAAPFDGESVDLPWMMVRPTPAAVRQKARGLSHYPSQLAVPTDSRYLPAFIRATELFSEWQPLPVGTTPVPVITKDPTRYSTPVRTVATARYTAQGLSVDAGPAGASRVTLTLPIARGVRRLLRELSAPGTVRFESEALGAASLGFLDLWQMGPTGRWIHVAPTRLLRWAQSRP
jgi:LmbE family N-acetylglucosaminyl deacetylase